MMRIFLCWSGDISKQVAIALREWLPEVIQNLSPFMSDEDIPRGAAWRDVLTKELKQTGFAIVSLTPENLNAPWINFEAGAVWKALDESRVAPILMGLRSSNLRDPLGSFNAVEYNEAKFKQLVRTLNDAFESPLKESIVDKAFTRLWPELKRKLDPLEEMASNLPEAPPSNPNVGSDEVLSEILQLVRDLDRRNARGATRGTFAMQNLAREWTSLSSMLKAYRGAGEDVPEDELIQALMPIDRAISRILRSEGLTYTTLRSVYARDNRVARNVAERDDGDGQ
jgi:TIR domain